ncbi:hypothetical protein J2T56_000387 [Natronobacillus azotifigens]|uniref:LysM domain-containing protein n=1 Tax=Natronobacillus azotifigens TaxID=472978 RepID=A0A9J6R8Z6_9BACI|nr:hypothetical protein [Natronobacillus azotifigens]MCZ0701838.1 hypothetical protein [Natronobacillus azotifigens]
MTEHQEDQAALLRKQMEGINQHEAEMNKDEDQGQREDTEIEMDVLNLPPRSEIHDEKRAKTRLKISIALVRLLVVLFLIIVGIVLTYHFWGDLFSQSIEHQAAARNRAGETVQIISNTDSLSQEVTIYAQLDPDIDELTPLTGRYYYTKADDTIESIAERFYQSSEIISLLRLVNNLTEDSSLENNQQIFLPTIQE